MILSACSNPQQLSTEQEPPTTQEIDEDPPFFLADLPDLGLAPELENEVWLNTNQALSLSELEGKVILLDMWTFG
jgi:hypothetical protein